MTLTVVRVQVPPGVQINERIEAKLRSFFALRPCQACLRGGEKAKKQCRDGGIGFHFQNDPEGARCEVASPARSTKAQKGRC